MILCIFRMYSVRLLYRIIQRNSLLEMLISFGLLGLYRLENNLFSEPLRVFFIQTPIWFF